MKKLFTFLAIAMIAGSALAATGWWSDFILVSVDGAAITAPDDYYWIGDDPSYGSQYAGSDFQITLGQTLLFGADMRYWGDNGDRTGGAFYWTVDNYATQNEVIWTQAPLGGNDFQGTQAATIDVAQGLGVGDYTVIVWAKSWGTSEGDSLLNDGGNNYSARLTVSNPIPEPATMSLLGLGALAMVLRRKIRK